MFRISSLEVPERVKPGEEFTVIAVVSHRSGGPPHGSQEVIFEANGTEFGQNMTDTEGRAQVDHVLNREATYSIAAQVRSIPGSRVRRTLTVKAEEPKDERLERKLKPIRRQTKLLEARLALAQARSKLEETSAPVKRDRIVVSLAGERGNYLLGISVVDADGAGIPFAKNIRVIRNGRSAAYQAEDDGTLVYPVLFASHIKIVAGGTEALQWEGVLGGPPEPAGPQGQQQLDLI